MAIVPEYKEQFLIHGPDILRKGESGIFSMHYEPEHDSAIGYTIQWGICRPDSSQVNPEATFRSISVPLFLFNTISFRALMFTPTQHGTHYIGVKIDTAGVGLGTISAIKAFHVPAWLDNIDKPISDITKANTEISRLRTQYDRAKSGGI